jgi:hypothetical protein
MSLLPINPARRHHQNCQASCLTYCNPARAASTTRDPRITAASPPRRPTIFGDNTRPLISKFSATRA